MKIELRLRICDPIRDVDFIENIFYLGVQLIYKANETAMETAAASYSPAQAAKDELQNKGKYGVARTRTGDLQCVRLT